MTFQEDVDDYGFIADALLLLAISVERRAERVSLYGEGGTLKITYSDMKSITRSKIIPSTRSAVTIYEEAARLLEQLRFDDFIPEVKEQQEEKTRYALETLGRRYGLDFAGNLDKIFHGETLYRTIEYMRKHRP